MAEIELVGLSHSYVDAEYALMNVNLTWDDGGAYALLGPSGCGKTTMLDIISGLLVPTEGQVLFDGRDVSTTSTADRNIAQVFQFPVLYGSMTVEQNLRFPLRNRGIDKRSAQKRAEEIAEVLEIGDLLRRKAKGLSADAKQLVSLGRALVRTDVSAILFDEPLTVIDPQKKWTIRQALKRVHQELNHTLVYVTHDQTEALTFADEVVVMSHGEVIQKGTPDELFERPSHLFVGSFIGSPGMNFLPVEVTGSVVSIGGVPLVRLPAGSCDFEEAARSGDLVAGIRPELVTCHRDPAPGRLPGTVERRHDLGSAVLMELTVGGAAVVAKLPDGWPSVGTGCWVELDLDHLVVFHKESAVEGVVPLRPHHRPGEPGGAPEGEPEVSEP
jgi:glycerol transport system ATP-binding protein